MVLNDSLANILSIIRNAEKTGKHECAVRIVSKTTREVLRVMNEHNYIGEIQTIDEARGGVCVIHLLGRINDCNAVKPRFSIKKDGYEKSEKRYLPAKGFGIIIVSTPFGVMDHAAAREKGTGGRIIAYCY